MSGRPKRDPADELRQLTREAHEAAQDARAAARDLRAAAREAQAARDAVARDLAERFQPVITRYQTQLQEHVDTQVEVLRTDTGRLQREIQERVASWLGASSPEELMDLILRQTADQIMGELRRITPAIGQAAQGRGRVLVATQEQLDAFRAAGGDPGIVLDAR